MVYFTIKISVAVYKSQGNSFGIKIIASVKSGAKYWDLEIAITYFNIQFTLLYVFHG